MTEKFKTFIVLELAEPMEGYFFTEPFSDKICKYFFKQLISAIQEMHKQKIYHMDLKPENLLFDKNFNLKISDFGTARIHHDVKSTIVKPCCIQTMENQNFDEVNPFLAPEIREK